MPTHWIPHRCSQKLLSSDAGGGVAFGHWITFLNSQVSPAMTGHIQEGKRAGGRATRHSRSSYHPCPHLHLLPSPPLDAGKYAVPPQVGNLDRRPLTTPVNHRLLLESGRDVSPTGRGPLNQEENIRRLFSKQSKRGGSRWRARLTDMRAQPVSRLGSKTTFSYHLIGAPLPPFLSTAPRAR